MTAVQRRRRRSAANIADGTIAVAQTPVAPPEERIKAALAQLQGFFAERDDALRCMTIAMLTGMNYLLIGPRGTAKTAMANCLMQHVQGSRHFSTLLGSFTTINDLVGRIDLAKLQQGIEERKTAGKLLDCDTAFLDEVLKGGDGTVNGLLGVLSDNRDFDGRRTEVWCCGSATNWPEVERRSDRIAALYDRFQLKVPVNNVQSRAGKLRVLRASRELDSYCPQDGTIITIDELRQAAVEIGQIEIDFAIEELLCSVHDRCAKESIEVSDRKLGQWQRALQASAWLAGRKYVGIEDFDVLAYMAWDNAPDISKVASIIQSCDLELVQGLIAKIDEARNGYQREKQKGLTAESAGVVLDNIIATAEHVNEALEKYQMRKESRRDVARAVKNLEKDFQAIYSKFEPAITEAATVEGGE